MSSKYFHEREEELWIHLHIEQRTTRAVIDLAIILCRETRFDEGEVPKTTVKEWQSISLPPEETKSNIKCICLYYKL